MWVCVSTCVCTMNHCVGTGVYSEAGLSVSITPLWLSLPGPLSTQTCLNTHTHTHPETGSMLEAKTLYTRPCLEHIMAFSELFWCNPTPQTKASSFTHAVFFRLHLCQHAHKNSCSSLGASKLTLIQLRCGRCSEVEPQSDPGSVWQPLTVLRCCDEAQRASLLSVFANRVLLRSR